MAWASRELTVHWDVSVGVVPRVLLKTTRELGVNLFS